MASGESATSHISGPLAKVNARPVAAVAIAMMPVSKMPDAM